jgi:hypothetical protein
MNLGRGCREARAGSDSLMHRSSQRSKEHEISNTSTTESARVVQVAAGLEISAYGKIGETSVGGVEIIGVDGDAYRSSFYDSFGNAQSSRMKIDGGVITWLGERTRCIATITDDGMTQVAHHEVSADGESWTASMDVTLRKLA